MGEGRSGGIVREPAIHRYALLYLKWIVNKDLLYSTGNAAQYTVKKKKKLIGKRRDTGMCITESLC